MKIKELPVVGPVIRTIGDMRKVFRLPGAPHRLENLPPGMRWVGTDKAQKLLESTQAHHYDVALPALVFIRSLFQIISEQGDQKSLCRRRFGAQALACFAQWLVIDALKRSVDKVRPCDIGKSGCGNNSFVSGHAGGAGFALASVIKENNLFSWEVVLATVMTVLTCSHRYFAKKHDLVDIGVGFAIGFSISWYLLPKVKS